MQLVETRLNLLGRCGRWLRSRIGARFVYGRYCEFPDALGSVNALTRTRLLGPWMRHTIVPPRRAEIIPTEGR